MADIKEPLLTASSEPVAKSSSLQWIVAQEGSRETYSLPLAFHRIGALRMAYADIWCRFGRGLLRRGPAGARALATRFHPEIPANLVVSFSPGAIISKTLLHFRRSGMGPGQFSK